jgi:PKD repeat protein
MKYALVLLSLLALGSSACPTTEPGAGFGADSGGTPDVDNDMRARPDVEQDPSALDAADDDGGDAGADGDAEASNQPPVARAVERIDTRVGDTVTFDGSASSDPDGVIVAWSWDFGDGATGEGAITTHVYTLAAIRTATLTVEDDEGATASTEIEVRVMTGANQPPVAVIGLPELPIPVGQEVTFDGRASHDPDGSLVAYDWEFREADEGTLLGIGSGTIVTRAFGQVGEVEVRLRVTDNHGAEGEALETVPVAVVTPPGHAPTANAGADQIVLLGSSVTLTGSGSDPDGAIVSWHWSFGDGNTASGQTVTHTYASPGTFTATLTVTDDDGLTGSDAAAVIVHRRPNAVITVLTPTPATGAPVSFSGLSSSDPDGHALTTFLWTFGDGGTGFGAEVAHTYATEGTYNVGLTVTDALGATGSTSLAVTVVCLSNCGATGTWRVRPFDSESSASGDCNELITVTVGPATCSMSQSGTSLSMDCGGGFVYTGTRTGNSFNVLMPSVTVPGDDFYCGDAYFTERITGTFVNDNRWEGQSELSVDFEWWDPFWCYDCEFLPFPKTGTRL